jgi:hypothetical protein
MADMLEQADEVQDALGRSYGMPEIDEDELAAELDALGDEIALDNDTSYLDEIKAPSAPSKEPGADSVINKVRSYCTKVSILKVVGSSLERARIWREMNFNFLRSRFGLS